MDYFALAAAALGGAMGGAIGSYAASRTKSKVWRSIALTFPLVVGVQFMPLLLTRLGLREKLAPPEAIESAAAKYSLPLLQDPKFRASVDAMSPEQLSAFVQRETLLGLKRLPLLDLERWNELRQSLASADATMCAGFWTGRDLDNARVQKAVSRLPPAELNDWVRISTKAAQLEVDQAAFQAPTVTPAEMLSHVEGSLPINEAERLSKAIDQGADLDDSEACWTMKTILKATATASAKDREEWLRILASL